MESFNYQNLLSGQKIFNKKEKTVSKIFITLNEEEDILKFSSIFIEFIISHIITNKIYKVKFETSGISWSQQIEEIGKETPLFDLPNLEDFTNLLSIYSLSINLIPKFINIEKIGDILYYTFLSSNYSIITKINSITKKIEIN